MTLTTGCIFNQTPVGPTCLQRFKKIGTVKDATKVYQYEDMPKYI